MESIRKLGSSMALMAVAAMAGLSDIGLAVGSQRTVAVHANQAKSRHDRNTGPKRLPRKQSQDRLAAAEAKRQRRQVRNLAHGRAGGIAFA
jgi:hypothetical protein